VKLVEKDDEADVKPEASEDFSNDAYSNAKFDAMRRAPDSNITAQVTQEVAEPRDPTTKVSEDAVVTEEGDDARTAAQSQLARNVPPHLRADFQAPAPQQASVLGPGVRHCKDLKT
jgi:hypothetical protein